MPISTYRTGQAAKLLGVSSHHLRRLCEAGEVEAELTSGNHWRIHGSEVDRLKKEGVPPVPAVVLETAAVGTPDNKPGRQGAPTESEAVRNERESVVIAESKLKRRQLELQQEETEDRFRERERKQRIEMQARQRGDWENRWREDVHNALPPDLEPSTRLKIMESVDELLSKRITPAHPSPIQRAAVDAIVQEGLTHYRQRKAVAEHNANISDVLSSSWTYAGLPETEKANARKEVERALAAVPLGASRFTLHGAAADALTPIKTRLAKEEKERANKSILMVQEAIAQGTEQVRRSLKLTTALTHISTYLNKEYEFDTVHDRWAEEKRLRELLQPEVEGLLSAGDVEDAEVKDYVESRIDQEQQLDDDGDDDDDDDGDDDDDDGDDDDDDDGDDDDDDDEW